MFEHSNSYLEENENEIKVSDSFYYISSFIVLSFVVAVICLIF